MDTDDGLVAAYALDGVGSGKALNWDEVHSWKAEQGLLWVRLDLTHPHARQWVNKESAVDEVVAEALLVDETRPRSSIMKNGLLVMLRGVNMNSGADPEDMVAIRIWIEDGRIITTRKRRLLSINDVRQSIDDNEGPTTPGELLVMLSHRLVVRMSSVIDDIDEEVDRH